MKYSSMIYPRKAYTELTSNDVRQAIETWESSSGINLPKDYRDFLIAAIGGFPFPGCFNLNLEQLPDFLDEDPQELFELYTWHQVEDKKKNKAYYNGYPDGYLVIADAGAPLMLLIGVRADNYGKLYLWYHSTVDWGSDVNNEKDLVPVAGSFRQFIDILYDDGDHLAKENWAAVTRAKNAKYIEF